MVVTGFGDVPVLAEEAAHVAARGAERKNRAARKKMIEGLLFDGIDLQRGRRAVAEAVEASAFVHADKTETALARSDMAMTGTEIAVHASAGFGFPPASFVKRGGLLKYVQVLHLFFVVRRLSVTDFLSKNEI